MPNSKEKFQLCWKAQKQPCHIFVKSVANRFEMAAKQRKKRRKIFVITPSCLPSTAFVSEGCLRCLSCPFAPIQSCHLSSYPTHLSAIWCLQHKIWSILHFCPITFLPFLLLVVFHNSGTPLPVYWRTMGQSYFLRVDSNLDFHFFHTTARCVVKWNRKFQIEETKSFCSIASGQTNTEARL